MLVSRWDLSRGHLNFAYARNVLLSTSVLVLDIGYTVLINAKWWLDRLATKQLLLPWNASQLVLRWTVPPSKFESHTEMNLRNVLRFSFQGNENSGDKHEIISIPFTNLDRLGSSKSYYVIVLGIGWPNCGGL
ncbi:hypothetical protein ALC57_14558 [Trachymyrmex cornetzi]|uniref:Uncharacterized protein n=1 Tax=Trachymyrmex cornetzi TaxID=471704 RepID=A0A151IY73_9HYME|nr:hypothetical protein ALC57_14558 [Trachymyrmex cornetzi]